MCFFAISLIAFFAHLLVNALLAVWAIGAVMSAFSPHGPADTHQLDKVYFVWNFGSIKASKMIEANEKLSLPPEGQPLSPADVATLERRKSIEDICSIGWPATFGIFIGVIDQFGLRFWLYLRSKRRS
jgi:hypothetical protein